MAEICVIFDLDGTLVDSETLCNQAFLDLLPELNRPVESLVARFRGMQLAAILRDIESEIGRPLPETFEAAYRAQVSALFARDLRAMPGVPDMLEDLAHPRCIASSGPLPKIRQALDVSGLAPHFGAHLFSSYEIGVWKPEPGLFLHAAREMGFAPEQCVVVEDSDVGVRAALSAGMKALHFLPHGLATVHPEAETFDDMSLLPAMIEAKLGR
ncbi:HAD-IA family hydrolase [Nisaea acidiphila]|uniref:HAD-IA family hydrolase n=1 Tax=Nisaea acidiphila TaxID=1862145 RepID=A0A9J7AM36_9PROT|nr:HAD-IA family hydrolase [Nisaea acidiphila]UUX48536.1 HAD-IA family hydrolase [Nisaea acidiphila]